MKQQERGPLVKSWQAEAGKKFSRVCSTVWRTCFHTHIHMYSMYKNDALHILCVVNFITYFVGAF